jgi:hypothetical protein
MIIPSECFSGIMTAAKLLLGRRSFPKVDEPLNEIFLFGFRHSMPAWVLLQMLKKCSFSVLSEGVESVQRVIAHVCGFGA